VASFLFSQTITTGGEEAKGTTVRKRPNSSQKIETSETREQTTQREGALSETNRGAGGHSFLHVKHLASCRIVWLLFFCFCLSRFSPQKQNRSSCFPLDVPTQKEEITK
jgi:hypothetical protein